MKTTDYLKALVKAYDSGTHLSNVECDVCKKDYMDFQSYPG